VSASGAVLIYPHELSSDRACRIELLDSVMTAVVAVMRAAIPGVPIEGRVHLPPESPQYRMVVAVKREWTTVPVEVRARLEEIGSQFRRWAPVRFPHLPLDWMCAWPPDFLYPALIAVAPPEAELPEPRYPHIVKVKAVLRPTAFGRKMLGLAPKED